MYRKERLLSIEYDRKICESGYAAIHNGNLVDIREHPKGELLTAHAVENILYSLESEESKLNLDIE